MVGKYLPIAYMAALTAVAGYASFRNKRYGGEPYGRGERALVVLAFIFGVVATIWVIIIALTR
jgi:hypothetical protein